MGLNQTLTGKRTQTRAFLQDSDSSPQKPDFTHLSDGLEPRLGLGFLSSTQTQVAVSIGVFLSHFVRKRTMESIAMYYPLYKKTQNYTRIVQWRLLKSTFLCLCFNVFIVLLT